MNAITILTFTSTWLISAIALHFGYDYDVIPTVALSTGIAAAVTIVTTLLSTSQRRDGEPNLRFLAWPMIENIHHEQGPTPLPTAPFPETLEN